MTTLQQMVVRGLAAIAVILATSAHAWAADTVRVTAAHGSIRAEPNAKSAIVMTVSKGAVLEVTAKTGEWYRVLAPSDRQGIRLAGYILARQVTVEAPSGRGAAASAPQKPAATKPPARPAKKPSRFTLRGFGSVEYEFFQAAKSFDAVFCDSKAVLFGAGGEVSIGPQLFVQGRVARVRKVGERAFVFGGEVFRLGIDDTVTLTPIDVSVGYRIAAQPRFRPYVAGGLGVLRYAEESEFATGTDQDSFLSYHVAGGVEVPITKWLAVAGEVQYRTVPNAIGSEGVGKEFSETNLGGTSVCVKFLVGRQPPRPIRPAKPPARPPRPKR